MYQQQQHLRWLDPLRGPRVRNGALGSAIALALLAGGVAFTLLAGSHATVAPATSTTVAAPEAGTTIPASPIRRELLVDDFRPGSQLNTTVAAPPVRREHLVGDFGPRSGAEAAQPGRIQPVFTDYGPGNPHR